MSEKEIHERLKSAALEFVLTDIALKNEFHGGIEAVEPGVYAFPAYARFGSAYDYIDALVRVRNALLRDARLKQQDGEFILEMLDRSFTFPNVQLQATLNNIVVRVDLLHEVDAEELRRDWDRACAGLLQSPIGPQAARFTHFDQLDLDKALRRIDAEQGAAFNACLQERAERKAALEQKLAGLTPVQYRNEANWQSARRIPRDDASRRIFDTVEAWMHLMQTELDRGKTFDDMAFTCYKEVDAAYAPPNNAIGVMITIIEHVWLYGPAFMAYCQEKHPLYVQKPATA